MTEDRRCKIGLWSLVFGLFLSLGLRSPVILHAQLQPDQVQRSVIDDSTNYCADAGSSDAYACSLTPPPAAYVTGARYRIRANTANTGAATVNFNSLGARTIKKWLAGVKSDLATGDIGVNQVVDFVYDGTDMVATSLGGSGGVGSIAAADVTFSPTGGIAGTDVQAAIAELRTESFMQRTFQNHTNVLTWTNADGIAGNPEPRIANSLIDGSNRFAADAGSSDDYAACPQSISTISIPAYVDKSIHGFTANTANTGAATLNLCSLGSRPLVKLIGGISTPLATGDILVGQPVLVVYNSGSNDFKIISQLATGGAGAGTPGGSNTQCQFNDSGIFGGDAGCTYDKSTDILNVSGGYTAGNVATNSTGFALGGGVSGHRIATLALNADYNVAGTTGTLTTGDASKFDSSGRLIRAGTSAKLIQFIIGAENGPVLTDGDDQPTIFFNHYGQGLTISEVWCESDAGTPSINLQRDDGSPANIMSSNLSCSTAGASSSTFSGTENQIASTNKVDFVMATAGGVAKRVTVSIKYTLD